MGAASQYYVDPSIDDDSGSGTPGSPYGDLQYALDSITRDSTNGDQINIKAGTAEVLTAALDLSTYGTPAAGAPLIFRGYTSTAGDGGIGEIDGDGSYSILGGNKTYVTFWDLKLGNCGSATVLDLGFPGTVRNCQVYGTSGNGLDFVGIAIGCYFNDIGGEGFDDGIALGCLFVNGTTNKFTTALQSSSHALGNMFVLDGASDAINLSGNAFTCRGNSILSSSGTGQGIIQANNTYNIIADNLIEGFSGTGGIGIDVNGTRDELLVTHNAVRDCATAYSLMHDNLYGEDNETLSATPFTKGTLPTDFTSSTFWDDVYAYFTPVDTGNVLSGLCQMAKGAVQPSSSGSGAALPRKRLQVIGA